MACRPTPDGPDRIEWIERESVAFAVLVRRRFRDSFTRTATPLALLLVVVWATSFWEDPASVAGMLINIFLACVALYFAEPKPIPGRTTFVDRLFLVCNTMIGLKLIATVLTLGSAKPTDAMRIVNLLSLVALPVAVAATLWVIWPRRSKTP